jgi:hypothetical protein
MHKFAFLVAAALALSLPSFAGSLGPVLGPAASVGLAVLLSCAASGSASAVATTGGAIGAFSACLLGTVSGAVAGACLLGLAFAERTIRVRTPVARAAHMGVAVLGGALAGTLSSAYASSSGAVQGVSLLVGSVLAGLPLLVDADDPIAHTLERAAARLPESVARSLREGAMLRRLSDQAIADPSVRRGVPRTWQKLTKLAETRLRLERTGEVRGVGPSNDSRPASARAAVVAMIDRTIADHVAALARAYTAVDTARAAAVGLDDEAARGIDAVGERLEEVSLAIVDVKA